MDEVEQHVAVTVVLAQVQLPITAKGLVGHTYHFKAV